jgi:beta-galactosidase
MWSIGNEIGGASVATATKLRDWVKAIDKSRPVTWACNSMGSSTNQQVAALLDLQGYNYQTGSYDGDHAAHPDWKMFGSEVMSAIWSRGYFPSPKPGNGDCDSTAMQCPAYDVGSASAEGMYTLDVNRSWFAGQFEWTGFDYGGEPYPYRDRWPAKSSYFGVVDLAGFPKDVYYFYQSKLTSEPMVHILPHWNWTAGTTVTVWVYSNCDSVELFLNDKSQGVKNVTKTTMHLEWSLPWSSGTLRAEGKRGGSVVTTQEMTTAGAAAQVKLTADRTEIAADGRDLVFITADIQDGSGVFVPTATSSVTFAVSGAGKLVAVDNGNPIDTTSYVSPTRKAFSGKVLAIVQSTGTPGQITVTATSSGLTQGTASATAK